MTDNSNNIATRYEEQLPQKEPFGFFRVANSIAAIVTILGFVASPYLFEHDSIATIYSIFLCFLVTVILIHSYMRERQKLHRYAQTTYFVHYVNHIARDQLKESALGNFENLEGTTQKILESVAQCYSLLSGKKCRACLKDLKSDSPPERFLLDVQRSGENRCSTNIKHPLQDNSDFEDLYLAKNGCSRYYLCNDLPTEYKKRKYKNSSFKKYGEPEISSISGWVKKWPLPYKSTLVLPIRYISFFDPPKNSAQNTSLQKWHFWGFLCIDCGSKNVF